MWGPRIASPSARTHRSDHRRVDPSTGLWDALFWATAKLNQIRYVLTEDCERGNSVEGVTYLDPFDPRFDPAAFSS